MKLSAKFAQETETARRARIGRRRIRPDDRLAAVRRLLDAAEPPPTDPTRAPDGNRGSGQ